MFSFKTIFVGIGILALGGWIWYQNNRIESLETKNTLLNQELNIAITTNTELTQNLEMINQEHIKQLEVLNKTLDKKEDVKVEIDRLKRKVSDEDHTVINTANDILNRMQQTTRNNNKDKN